GFLFDWHQQLIVWRTFMGSEAISQTIAGVQGIALHILDQHHPFQSIKTGFSCLKRGEYDRSAISHTHSHCIIHLAQFHVVTVMPAVAERAVVNGRAVPDSLPYQWQRSREGKVDVIGKHLAAGHIHRVAGDGTDTAM